MSPVMSPLPGHDYDFEMSIRPNGASTRAVDREALEAFLASLAGVRRHEARGFVLDSPLGRWMEITPQWRTADGLLLTGSADDSVRVNYIHLHFPAKARGPTIDRDYMRAAFAIADHLGWRVHDDTDSDDWVSKEMLEASRPATPKKPWWKLW